MIFCIIAGVILCASLIYGLKEDVFDGITFALLAGGILALIFYCISAFAPQKIDTTVEKYNLTAIQDSQSFSGSGSFTTFLLIGAGSGSMSSDLEYTVLMETANGYISKTYDANTTYLKYDNNNPRVEVTTRQSKTVDWWNRWVVPFIKMNNTEPPITTIYVPSGSISREYSIDLQ